MSESKHSPTSCLPTQSSRRSEDNPCRPVSSELQLRLKNKKIATLESVIQSMKVREAYRMLRDDEELFHMNEQLNGFGILIQKLEDHYEVLHAQTGVKIPPGTLFQTYTLEPNTALTLLPPKTVGIASSTKWLKVPVRLEYSVNRRIDLATECQVRTNTIALTRRKVRATLKQLQSHFRGKIRSHHETAVFYKCCYWVCLAMILFLAFSVIVLSCVSLVAIDTGIRTVFALSIVLLCFVMMIVFFVQSQLRLQFKAHNHKLIAQQYRHILTKITFERDHPSDSVHFTRLYFRQLVESLVDVHSLFQHSIPSHVSRRLETKRLHRSMEENKQQILQAAIEKKTDEIHHILEQTKNPNMINIRKLNRKFNSMIV